jgi:dTDP-4-dehydrorhamnose reductase
MRWLITGAGGMLGHDLVQAGAAAGWDVVPLSHAELDIADRRAVEERLIAERPDIVINSAAWTDVDGAEQSSRAAMAVNGTGAGHVARAADRCRAWTIQISSDYVFDGRKQEPYVESDPTHPLSAYGHSKLAGERAVAENAPDRHTVVRSSWLFGVHGRCFPATIIRLASEREQLTVVDDQRGCPTFTGHLARAVVQLADGPPPPGVVHLAGAGSCSWFELAARVVQLAGLDCQLLPITTAEMPRPAVRPAYSVLGTERAGLPELPSWSQGVEEFVAVRV